MDEHDRITMLEKRVERVEESLDVLQELRERLIRIEERIANSLSGCGQHALSLSKFEDRIKAIELKVAMAQGMGWFGKAIVVAGAGFVGFVVNHIVGGK